jgi:hypothetical protein
MSNTKMLETSAMYEHVKKYKKPRDVLKILSKLEPEFGWHSSSEIRFLTYGLWLSKNKPDWYDYFVSLNNAIKIMKLGGVPSVIPDRPSGWIDPIPYFNGK